jgi:hypothetical protein
MQGKSQIRVIAFDQNSLTFYRSSAFTKMALLLFLSLSSIFHITQEA